MFKSKCFILAAMFLHNLSLQFFSILKTYLITAVFLLAGMSLFGQKAEGLFDYNQISEAKVRKLLKAFDIKSLSDFNAINTQCYNAADSATFRSHSKSYTIEAPIEQVWERYVKIPPHIAWQCLMVDYAFSFAGERGTVCHNSEDFTGLEKGQLHFLNLNFLGLFKLAVGHKVTRLDAEAKTIKFCYLENGSSRGSQWISMKALEDSTTEVTHYTRYKSPSHFRDKNLYPTIHSMIINAYHHNIKRNLRRKMRRSNTR